MDILNEARRYLVEFFKGKRNPYETTHPWRKSWEFAVLHSLRVEAYVLKILEREEHNLTGEEITLLRMAAILHDIGRFEGRDDHAAVGREIVRTWFQERPEIRTQITDVERLLELIADHSNKGRSYEPDYGKAVLKDADLLDEIGVMSVMMTTNRIDRQSPYFFYHLMKRLREYELPYCDQQFRLLKTQGARDILREKKAFIEALMVQLEDEMECDNFVDEIIEL